MLGSIELYYLKNASLDGHNSESWYTIDPF